MGGITRNTKRPFFPPSHLPRAHFPRSKSVPQRRTWNAYHLRGKFGEKFPSNGTGIFMAPKTGTGLSCTIYKIPVKFLLSVHLKPGTSNPHKWYRKFWSFRENREQGNVFFPENFHRDETFHLNYPQNFRVFHTNGNGSWSTDRNVCSWSWTRPRKMEGFCRVLSHAKSPTKSPTLISSSLVVSRWLVPAASRSAGSSSAFPLANSSAMVFLSFAVRRSSVIRACCRSKIGKEKGVLGWRETRGGEGREAYLQKLKMASKHLKPNVITLKSLLHLEKKVYALGPCCSQGG